MDVSLISANKRGVGFEKSGNWENKSDLQSDHLKSGSLAQLLSRLDSSKTILDASSLDRI